MLQLPCSHPIWVRAVALALSLWAVSGCNALPFLHFGHPGAKASPPAPPTPQASPPDPINSTAIDADGSCGVVTPDQAALAMKPLSNSEYDLTIKDLLSTAASAKATAAFPPDATGTGFDTGAAHTMTTTLAQSYLDSSQSLAAAYVAAPGAICADQAFAASCTADALVKFAERAFRRPLLSDESTRLHALPRQYALAGLSDQEAYSAAVATVLMAPQFLYRSKVAVTDVPHADQYALASRISYALWGSMPDDALLSQAAAGRLADPVVLAGEIDRLIVSAKAQGFMRNFTAQWLGTKGLAQAPAASHLDAALVSAFSEETLDFVSDFLQQNLNVRNLLDVRFTYANERLAKHYGFAGPTGEEMRRTLLSGDQRGGLLTQGSFLLQTSNPDGTSPVKRGKWVLDRILCAPPPPPPAGVQTVLAKASGKAMPMRQRLATHRASTACAGCHTAMDPIGLGFENYDYAGQWRDKDDYGPIDASGTLPGGGAFATPADLVRLVKADAAFPRCMASKLAKYTLGREATPQEQCLIQKIAARTSDESYGLKNMLVDLSRALLTN